MQGGLAVTWAEVSEIRYEWTGTPMVTGNVVQTAAAGLTTAALAQAGLDGSVKVFEIRLKDFRGVKARSTSKSQRLVMFGPMLGDPGYLRVGLGMREPAQMRALLELLQAQTQRHGIPFTRANAG